MRRLFLFSRPFGSRIRLLPSARFYRREDHAWAQPGRGMSWERVGAPESSYRFDDFIHHGMKRHAKDVCASGGMTLVLCYLRPPPCDSCDATPTSMALACSSPLTVLTSSGLRPNQLCRLAGRQASSQASRGMDASPPQPRRV